MTIPFKRPVKAIYVKLPFLIGKILTPAISIYLRFKPVLAGGKGRLFGRAFSNLLANAVSYTEKDHTINVYFKNKNLIIENECEPIPPEHLEHLFEPFYRPEFARDRDSGGNGLGLYIVNTIFSVLNVSYQFIPMHNQKGMRFCIQL